MTPDGRDRFPTIPGHELSGVVEAVAPDVTTVKPGDAVFALTDFWRNGAAADYVAVHAADLAPKPDSLSHAQAAAVPLSGLTAWQALFGHANLSAGQVVLIHGAAGGVGTYAVQLARWRGARVVGTARMVRGVFFIVKPNRAQLIAIARLIDAGRIRPIVDATFPLERAREAFERGLRQHDRGKLVLAIDGQNHVVELTS